MQKTGRTGKNRKQDRTENLGKTGKLYVDGNPCQSGTSQEQQKDGFK